MKRLVLEGKKDRAKKRQLNEEIGNPYGTPTGAANEDDVEVQEVEMFTNPTTPTTTNRKGKEKVTQTSTQNKKKVRVKIKYSTTNDRFLCTTNNAWISAKRQIGISNKGTKRWS
eukprot:TRINITY_DN19892_c0_g1_i1.p1 TRINITY_DN19892_c0_g1~~TRINITY_DN19892_c0_g1_i1.p1  ORF type:complete len:114 (+),score=22.72 TRINITY_DN19892_c0_g1_i1:617-958(+)